MTTFANLPIAAVPFTISPRNGAASAKPRALVVAGAVGRFALIATGVAACVLFPFLCIRRAR